MKFLFLVLMLSSIAFGEERVARFYEIGGSTDGKPLFVQKIRRTVNTSGQMQADSTMEDASGKVVMTETAVMSGGNIVSQRMDQLQIGESYELQVQNGKATFRTFKIKNNTREKVSENTVSAGASFVTGPPIEFYLKGKLKKDGDVAEVEFGVFELEKSFDFKFKQLGPNKAGNGVRVQLKPAGFFTSLFVSEIEMEFERDSFKLLTYTGRTPARRMVDGSWKAFDAYIIYEDVN